MRQAPPLPSWAYQQGLLAGAPRPRRNRGCLIGGLALLLVPVLLCGGVSAWTAISEGMDRRATSVRVERMMSLAESEQSPVAATDGKGLALAAGSMSHDELRRALDPLILAEQVRYDGGPVSVSEARERAFGEPDDVPPGGYRVYEDETGEASYLFDMAGESASPSYRESARVLIVASADGQGAGSQDRGREVLGFRESSPGSGRWWLVGVTTVYPDGQDYYKD